VQGRIYTRLGPVPQKCAQPRAFTQIFPDINLQKLTTNSAIKLYGAVLLLLPDLRYAPF